MALASTLDLMDDGTGKAKPLTSLCSFLDKLSPAVLPLLSQQPQFFPLDERIELSHSRICSIVDVNCHGGSKQEREALQVGDYEGAVAASKKGVTLEGGSTELYPAVSMINHASTPNCIPLPIRVGGKVVAMAVVAQQRVLAGEELTLSYLDDAAVVQWKWGITD
mmetsp:Transcript_59804/g.159184  ORF Transcript_59804/g.159184 Transcript_59804/m.159184 type:complete len:165 (+) Transcript_59804:1201-1695(+)